MEKLKLRKLCKFTKSLTYKIAKFGTTLKFTNSKANVVCPQISSEPTILSLGCLAAQTLLTTAVNYDNDNFIKSR